MKKIIIDKWIMEFKIDKKILNNNQNKKFR